MDIGYWIQVYVSLYVWLSVCLCVDVVVVAVAATAASVVVTVVKQEVSTNLTRRLHRDGDRLTNSLYLPSNCNGNLELIQKVHNSCSGGSSSSSSSSCGRGKTTLKLAARSLLYNALLHNIT